MLGARFPNLLDYCAIVVILFLGTCIVEFSFSMLGWEKDGFRKAMSNFDFEKVLQTKQYLFTEQLLEFN